MISHKNKFIFIHIPKTGGTSLEAVLAGYGKLLQGEGNFHSIYFKHITASKLQVMLGTEYKSYFKFTIVRNPWDWLVSVYEFCRGFSYPFLYGTSYTLKIPDEFYQMDFETWLKWFGEKHGLQQVDIISGIDGQIAVDRIFRFEELDQCSRELSEQLSLELSNDLPKLKSSDRKGLSFYYENGVVIDLVGRYFERDIELFNYQFDDLVQ